MAKKVALVTGTSSGIGEATARKLHEVGFTVYGGARRVERMADLRDEGIRTLALDVTDPESVGAAIATIVEETGRIDALVNNAGYGSYGAVEEVPMAEGRYQFDVNVFGVAALIQGVLPLMRAQGGGRIVNISSMGGKVCIPLGAWYHASKFALEGFSDALRNELKPFGIGVVIVEPGAIRSEWSGIAVGHLLEVSGAGPYKAQADALADGMTSSSNVRFMSSPEVVASAVARAVTSRRPRTRYAVGAGAKPAIALRRVLSDRAFDLIVRRLLA